MRYPQRLARFRERGRSADARWLRANRIDDEGRSSRIYAPTRALLSGRSGRGGSRPLLPKASLEPGHAYLLPWAGGPSACRRHSAATSRLNGLPFCSAGNQVLEPSGSRLTARRSFVLLGDKAPLWDRSALNVRGGIKALHKSERLSGGCSRRSPAARQRTSRPRPRREPRTLPKCSLSAGVLRR